MKRRQQRRRFARLLLWSTLLVVFLLGYLNANPIRLSTEDPEASGRPRTGADASEVVVVLASDEIARSADVGRFAEVDWSWAWVDLLQWSVGPVRLLGPEDLDREALDGARFAVITHSAMAHPAVADSLHWLEQFVNRGGTLVLERPDGPLREAFSADGRGGQRTPRAITHAAEVSEAFSQALTALPLFTRYVGSTGPLEEAETLLGMDGAPVVYRVAKAGGWAVTVDFNLGLALVSLMQGRPEEPGFEVLPSHPALGPTVADLVADATLQEATLPYGDLLAHFLVEVALGGRSPVIALWPYPDGADGVVLLTHAVPAGSPEPAWMARHEAEQEATASFFFAYGATPPPEPMEALRLAGAGVGVFWERGVADGQSNRESIGLGGFRPFFRRVALARHRQALVDAGAEAVPVTGLRLGDGLWASSWAEPLRAAAAAGFRFDSSYGAWTGQPGALPAYRHGTGRPFQVYDQNGLPLGLYEVPVLAPDLDSTRGLERFGELLTQSQQTMHGVLTVQVGADLFARPDALTRFDQWREVIRLAGEQRHPVMSIERYLDFLAIRQASSLHSQFLGAEGGPPAADEAIVRLTVEVDAAGEGVWLRVPRVLGERRVRAARRQDIEGTGASAELDGRPIDLYARDYLLLPLEPGPQRVEVEYR